MLIYFCPAYCIGIVIGHAGAVARSSRLDTAVNGLASNRREVGVVSLAVLVVHQQDILNSRTVSIRMVYQHHTHRIVVGVCLHTVNCLGKPRTELFSNCCRVIITTPNDAGTWYIAAQSKIEPCIVFEGSFGVIILRPVPDILYLDFTILNRGYIAAFFVVITIVGGGYLGVGTVQRDVCRSDTIR